jgi:Colicin V production protein
MINATVIFWVLIAIFGFIGIMRGWQKEVIATASVILALFALTQLNANNRLTNVIPEPRLDGLEAVRQQELVDSTKVNRFFVQAVPFLVVTFFGYLGPAITRQFQAGKFPDKARVGVQEGVVGFLIGGINGWLVISTLAYFAFRLNILPDQGQFPSVGPALFMPPAGGWSNFFFIESAAPVLLAGPTLVIAMVVLFLFVIIAFI